MCPHERVVADGDDEADMVSTEEVVNPEEMGDPLDEFAVAAARRQAAERDEEGVDEGVNEAFIQRALAESRRMRGEASLSLKKRADLAAKLAAQHGESGVSFMAAAMAEHASEVLAPRARDHTAADESTDDMAVPRVPS